MTQQIRDIENVIEGLGSLGYVADRALATAVYLLLKLEKPHHQRDETFQITRGC
jgi:hypothetical protein